MKIKKAIIAAAGLGINIEFALQRDDLRKQLLNYLSSAVSNELIK